VHNGDCVCNECSLKVIIVCKGYVTVIVMCEGYVKVIIVYTGAL